MRGEWGIVLRRRWVIRLPYHEEQVCTCFTKLYRGASQDMSNPEGLNKWLIYSLTCIRMTGDKATLATGHPPFPKASRWMSEILNSFCDSAPYFSVDEHGSGYRLPVGFDLAHVKENVFQHVERLRCACKSLWGDLHCAPPLLNTTGHLIL